MHRDFILDFCDDVAQVVGKGSICGHLVSLILILH